MPNILEEFAYGNVNPGEGNFKKDKTYNKSVKKLLACEVELLDALDESQKKLYEQYSAANREFSVISDNERFVSGFKLGSRIMLEVMTGDLEEIL